jgi:hypothetical protein
MATWFCPITIFNPCKVRYPKKISNIPTKIKLKTLLIMCKIIIILAKTLKEVHR